MIMRQMLCLFGVSTLISLLVIMVFYSGDGFIEQVKQFIWIEVFIGCLYGTVGLIIYGGMI